MRKDPPIGMAYLLKADNFATYSIRNAVFPTLTSLRFDITMVAGETFFEYLLNGYLPYQSWSLVIMDSALNELGSYFWTQSTVISVTFSGLDASANALISLSVELSLTGLTEGSQASGGQATAASATTQTRKDPLPAFCFEFRADGLEDVRFSVSKIGAFRVGPNLHDDLVLTVNPEANADPFRDWLSGGNEPKSGTIDLLATNLRSVFCIHLESLRVTSVAPPLTTFAPTPAKVQLNYGSISFEMTKYSAPPPRAVPTKRKHPILGVLTPIRHK